MQEFDGKYVIHSEHNIKNPMEAAKKAKAVSALIDEAFRARGVSRLYTWGIGDAGDEYNVFLGYYPTGFEITSPTWTGDPIYEFAKDL